MSFINTYIHKYNLLPCKEWCQGFNFFCTLSQTLLGFFRFSFRAWNCSFNTKNNTFQCKLLLEKYSIFIFLVQNDFKITSERYKRHKCFLYVLFRKLFFFFRKLIQYIKVKVVESRYKQLNMNSRLYTDQINWKNAANFCEYASEIFA